jgi:phosphoribosyl-dephospho-CoA transferase
MDPRPHDLLWVRGRGDVVSRTPLPRWASDDWLAIAPVVVRRECTEEAVVPVGLRGCTRSERHAAYVPRDRIVRQVTPDELAQQQAWKRYPELLQIPCIGALPALVPIFESRQLSWGITGSAGFALATGIGVVRSDSDLDILIRAPEPVSRDDAAHLIRSLAAPPIRIDVQVDTGAGGFALAEWARRSGRVLLKTADGPLLVNDPWQRQT